VLLQSVLKFKNGAMALLHFEFKLLVVLVDVNRINVNIDKAKQVTAIR
jgi:hypothetical protein